MISSIKALCCAIGAALLAGCAQSPQIPLKPEAQARIRSVALLDVVEPQEHIVFNITGAPAIFGLLGGLAHAQDTQRKTGEFTESMKARKLSAGPALTNALEESLQARGLQVHRLEGVRVGVKDGGLADFSTVKTDADAILNVLYFAAGYLSPASSTDYLPWVRVFARLITSSPPYEIIYFQVLNYGAELAASETVIQLPAPDGKFRYPTFEELMAAGKTAGDGILGAATPIAERIASQLRPGAAAGSREGDRPQSATRRGEITLDDLKDLLPKE